MRSIGLDIHRDFCEVAIAEGGEVRSPGRIEMTPAALELFAGSLASTDQVALEVSGNAWEVARIIRPHVAKLVVVSPADTGIRAARAKTDRLDARALARLLAAGSLQSVWVPDDHTRAMRRRLQRRRKLLVVRTKAKNEIHAALMRRLVRKPAVSDLFGKRGRRWLESLELPDEEQETVEGCLRQLDFCESEIAAIEKRIATEALRSPEIRRLMTAPGVNVICAATFMAAVGDIHRFGDPASWSATWDWTRRCASRVFPPRRAGESQSRAPRRADTPWSRRAGASSRHRGRCTPTTSASALGEAARSRSSLPRASWPVCSGACSPARRTTPTRNPR